MNQTKTEFIKFTKVLTNDDILTYAKNIGEIRKKIDEAEAAKSKLRGLNYEMEQITKILEQGEISEHCRATFSFHDPEENMVTITPPSMVTRFEPIIREMTPEEKEKYCQHTIEFEEPEEEEEKPTGMVEKEWPDEAEIPSETISEIKPYYIEKDDHYYVVKTFNKSFPWVLWKRVYKGNKIVETNGVFYGTSREEIIMKLEDIKLVRSLETGTHLLNSTGDYDMIENEDGSISARIKEESDK